MAIQPLEFDYMLKQAGRDGDTVHLKYDDSESLEKALKLLRKKVNSSKILKILKYRTKYPSKEARDRAKRDRAAGHRMTRERNQARLNTSGLTTGKRRR